MLLINLFTYLPGPKYRAPNYYRFVSIGPLNNAHLKAAQSLTQVTTSGQVGIFALIKMHPSRPGMLSYYTVGA